MDKKGISADIYKTGEGYFENAVTGRKSFFDEWVRNPF